jgi:aminoglycoside phosphotransferase (APT) family kinase protein
MTHPAAKPLAEDLESLGHRLAAWLNDHVAGPAGQGGPVTGANVPSSGDAGICTLQPSAGGFSNQTWVGTWERKEAGSIPIVLRLQSATPTVFPDSSIDKQVRVMAALAGTAVPVPRLLGREEGVEVLGAPFAVMERVPGRVPQENPLYHLEGWFHELDAPAQRRHWFSGIDSLAAIARVDRSACEALGLGFLAPPPGVGVLEHQLQTWLEMLGWVEATARPYPHLHKARDWLCLHAPPPGPVSLSWGDAKLGNCVFDAQGRVVAALDWEQAGLAHPVDDLAWWLMLDNCLSEGYGVPRLAGLPGREETVAHWELASGLRADHLDYHEVFASWRMSIIMARIGTLFTQRGWVPAEAEMDLRNGASALLAGHAQRLGF